MLDRVLLITGAAGAGKTTLATEWASSRGSGCAHLSLDMFRHLIKSGYQDPRLGWNDEAQRQLDLTRSNMAVAAINYLKADFDVVIDDAVFPNWQAVGLDRWRDALPGIGIDLIVLKPDWSIVQRRNSERGEDEFVPKDVLRTIYDDMAGWSDKSEAHVIDNSSLSVSETIVEIERVVRY